MGGAGSRAQGDFLTEDGLPSFHDIRAECEVIRQRLEHAKTMTDRAIRRGDYSVSQYYLDEVSWRHIPAPADSSNSQHEIQALVCLFLA